MIIDLLDGHDVGECRAEIFLLLPTFALHPHDVIESAVDSEAENIASITVHRDSRRGAAELRAYRDPLTPSFCRGVPPSMT